MNYKVLISYKILPVVENALFRIIFLDYTTLVFKFQKKKKEKEISKIIAHFMNETTGNISTLLYKRQADK